MTKADAKRREEAIKHIASGLANIGTASFIAGFVAPAFGGTLGPYSILLGFAFGLGFHTLGQLVIQFVVVDDPAEDLR